MAVRRGKRDAKEKRSRRNVGEKRELTSLKMRFFSAGA
jgi:hypothetical protein